jgi:uncharacterized LabA/DUF88 family protein
MAGRRVPLERIDFFVDGSNWYHACIAIGLHGLNQERFLAALCGQDPRISVHLGRIEPRPVVNEAAMELKRYLSSLRIRIAPAVYRDLMRIAEAHDRSVVMVEKAVDVQIAVDIVTLAERDAYDTAFLLSADGDLTPAVAAARENGRRVVVASPARSAQLASAADLYLQLRRAWFTRLFD